MMKQIRFFNLRYVKKRCGGFKVVDSGRDRCLRMSDPTLKEWASRDLLYVL